MAWDQVVQVLKANREAYAWDQRTNEAIFRGKGLGVEGTCRF